jgi:hypothetical protein
LLAKIFLISAHFQNSRKLVLIECIPDDYHFPKTVKSYLYPGLMIISTVFLLLTLFAYFVAPEMNDLQGKSIACQSGTLAVSFIGYTVVQLTGDIINNTGCKIAGI